MEPLTPRQRVTAALNHQEPDRVPISVGGTAHKFSDSRYRLLKDHFGLEGDAPLRLTGFSMTPSDARLEAALGIDFRYVHLRPPAGYRADVAPDGSWVDGWGLTHKIIMGFYDLGDPPLAHATIDDLDRHTWPDPDDPALVEGLMDEVIDLHENADCAITAYRPTLSGIFDMGRFLVGTERLLMGMVQDKAFVDALFWKLAEVIGRFYEVYLDVVGPYVHIVEIGDDYGTQRGPFFSPRLYRELIMEKNAAIARIVKEKAPQAKFMLHSCGSVRAFIPDLIDSGIEVLNPVQPLAKDMDPAALKADFGKDIVFLGGVDVQQAMIGPVEQVAEEVRLRIDQLAPGGGFVLAPAHNFGSDVPLENILAFFETARDYGVYRR
jgi:uroporphyrinogen decarboxylase